MLGIFNGSGHVHSHANWKVSFSIIGFLVSRENFSWPWTWHVASCCTKILNVCQSENRANKVINRRGLIKKDNYSKPPSSDFELNIPPPATSLVAES